MAAAIRIVHSVFPREAKRGIPEKPYRESLDPKSNKYGHDRLEYHIALDAKGRVVGTTGFYSDERKPRTVVWVGWYCVKPSERGKGYGRAILEWTIAQARAYGYQLLKLYTSEDPTESVAQILYDKLGFRVTCRRRESGEPYRLIYRKKKL